MTTGDAKPLTSAPDARATMDLNRLVWRWGEHSTLDRRLTPARHEVGGDLAAGVGDPTRAQGDCYEAAFMYLVRHAARDAVHFRHHVRLVHGVCLGDLPLSKRSFLWGHAWVELPAALTGTTDLVFDGSRQTFFDRDGFYEIAGARAERSYSPQEVGAIAAPLKGVARFSPWHEDSAESVVSARAAGRHRGPFSPTCAPADDAVLEALAARMRPKPGPDAPPDERLDEGYHDLLAEDVAGALGWFTAVLADVPGQAEAIGFCGLLAFHAGQPRIASDLLRVATMRRPRDPRWRNTRSLLRLTRPGQ